MYTQQQINDCIREQTGLTTLAPGDDLFNDHGVVGDDFHDLMDEYSTQFGVDMDNYLWYFHCDEEGYSIGSLFFKPPYRRVQRIPVTPALLLAMANQGYWNVPYLKHQLPKQRYDLLINKFLVAFFIALGLLLLLKNIVAL